MRRTFYLFAVALLAVALAACEETEEAGRYDNWRARNDAFIDSLAQVFEQGTDPTLQRFSLFVNPSGYIYYKAKTPVESEAQNTAPEVYGHRPTYGATVRVYYKGVNMLGERFDGFYGDNPNIDSDDEVNVNEGETNPVSFSMSALVTGWQEALQRMTVGERWEVFIPWEYGYGSRDREDTSGNVTVRAYSTLIFDIQLLDADEVAER